MLKKIWGFILTKNSDTWWPTEATAAMWRFHSMSAVKTVVEDIRCYPRTKNYVTFLCANSTKTKKHILKILAASCLEETPQKANYVWKIQQFYVSWRDLAQPQHQLPTEHEH